MSARRWLYIHGTGDDPRWPTSAGHRDGMLARHFEARGLMLLDRDRRWFWSGGIPRDTGIPLGVGNDWLSAEESLFWRLRDVDDDDLNIVAHSYGGVVAILLAIRRPIRRLITVGLPPRKEIRAWAREALASGGIPADTWLHVYDYWDWIRTAAMLFDGELRWSGAFKLPRMMESCLHGIGHTRVLTEERYAAVHAEWAGLIHEEDPARQVAQRRWLW